jgi:hypothetical protein
LNIAKVKASSLPQGEDEIEMLISLPFLLQHFPPINIEKNDVFVLSR